MGTFTKISKQAVAERTVELVLGQLEGNPILVVRHLGETNREFWADALAKAGSASVGKRSKLSPNAVAKARLENREVVAEYAVVGLKNVFDDDGKPATNDDISSVVYALPDDVFDTVLRFVMDPDNFRDRSIVADPKEIAGKS